MISSFIVCVCYLLEVELSAGALCSTGSVLQAETSHSPTDHHCSPSPFKACASFLPEEDFEHAGPFMASFDGVCNVLQFESSRPLPRATAACMSLSTCSFVTLEEDLSMQGPSMWHSRTWRSLSLPLWSQPLPHVVQPLLSLAASLLPTIHSAVLCFAD